LTRTPPCLDPLGSFVDGCPLNPNLFVTCLAGINEITVLFCEVRLV
jgi:hypothetical protein